MTPASSVLLLTTLTGFGYGLLAWLGFLAVFGALPPSPFFLPFAVVVALGFSSAGLVASTLHLGHPERAWRAFSQWRSSWLSREGVASLATFPPALTFAGLWWLLGPDATATRALGLIAACLGLITGGSRCRAGNNRDGRHTLCAGRVVRRALAVLRRGNPCIDHLLRTLSRCW